MSVYIVFMSVTHDVYDVVLGSRVQLDHCKIALLPYMLAH